MRLKDKTAIVIGAGQGPGTGMGNGRATVIRFVQEGATVLAVDRDLASAQETCAMAAKDSKGKCEAFAADVTREASMQDMIAHAQKAWGRIDILHYNVGVSLAGGDAPPDSDQRRSLRPHRRHQPARPGDGLQTRAAGNARAEVRRHPRHLLDRRDRELPLRHLQGDQGGDDRLSCSSWRSTKPGNGIRANIILPGLMDTPMAVDTRARHSGKSRAEVAAMRDSHVPLRHKMGTAWDVANAALFLASDEANFITGVALPVDGGALVKIG